MEELAGATDACRQVFERWMQWEPNDHAWLAYIKFESRNDASSGMGMGSMGRARGLYERYVSCHPTPRAYMRYAKWEEHQRLAGNARRVYERATEEVHESLWFDDLNHAGTLASEGASRKQGGGDEASRDGKEGGLLLAFARFEEKCREYERAEAIYAFALDRARSRGNEAAVVLLSGEVVAFQKRHGGRESIEVGLGEGGVGDVVIVWVCECGSGCVGGGWSVAVGLFEGESRSFFPRR